LHELRIGDGAAPPYVLPGQPQHVIQRGNNREPIFAQAAGYAFYLKKLKLACEQRTSVIHAYGLMTHHVHLLMTPTSKAGMGNVM
jgi:putative transposase